MKWCARRGTKTCRTAPRRLSTPSTRCMAPTTTLASPSESTSFYDAKTVSQPESAVVFLAAAQLSCPFVCASDFSCNSRRDKARLIGSQRVLDRKEGGLRTRVCAPAVDENFLGEPNTQYLKAPVSQSLVLRRTGSLAATLPSVKQEQHGVCRRLVERLKVSRRSARRQIQAMHAR